MAAHSQSRLRGNLSLVISCLALVVALTGTAYAAGLAPGSVTTKAIAKGAVTTKKIHSGAVTRTKIRPGAVRSAALADGSVGASELVDGSVGASELADGSVGTGKIADRSIRMHDLGGDVGGELGVVADQTFSIPAPISVAVGTCREIQLLTLNPTPPGVVGSMVVGIVRSSTGGPVLDNSGYFVPTMVSETNQDGVVFHLGVCAGTSPQTIPAGSIATWSLIAP
jgi:hypothetical protein